MKVIKNENIRPFDVDNTLVMHLTLEELDKLTSDYKLTVYDPIEDSRIFVGINKPMVRLLKEELRRGAQVVVWSRGGYEWASNVVKALGLEDEDILVMSKPLVYFDDMDISEWCKDRIYIKYDSIYKNFVVENLNTAKFKSKQVKRKKNVV